MPALQDGSKGTDVKKLQEALKQRGFNPGAVDGDFGPADDSGRHRIPEKRGIVGRWHRR
jgi:peptidoglycan hydrolase-like protein with peptidoglycan-binding domain